jgi:uracil-DNA glycosylase family 4
MGFFQPTKSNQKKKVIRSILPQCGRCGRHTAVEIDKFGKKRRVCQSPKLPVSGEGRLEILIVREQPTQMNDASVDWFASEGGKSLLGMALHNAGVDMQEDCWVTGAAICYGKGNPLIPIECCRPYLLETIKKLNPKVIVPVGLNATRAVLAHLWREGSGEMSRFYGYQIPAKKWNAWVCPTYDSAYILSLGNRFVDKSGHKPDIPQGLAGVAFLWMSRHIEAMTERLPNRPNDAPSQDRITLLYNPEEIADVLERIGNSPKGWAVFDYEANCLKPEVDGARVLCASVCLGGWNKDMITVAFPMSNAIRNAWIRFLQSPVPKIAHNLKMEDRWSRVHFGTAVNNWAADTMLNAHILNCSKGVTGLKFQAFAHFGESGYDEVTQPYLSGAGKLNRLHELPIEKLLLYCAMDSLLTWRLAVKQMRELGQEKYWQ